MNNYLDNHISEWRIYSRMTAYSQLIASILGIFVIVLAAMVFVIMDVQGFITDLAYPRTLYVVAAIFVLSGHLWSSVQLIKATGLGREINDALKLCQSWQIITGVCLILMDILGFVGCYMIVTYSSHAEVNSISMVKGSVVAIVLVSSQIYYHYIIYRFMLDLDNNRQRDHQALIA